MLPTLLQKFVLYVQLRFDVGPKNPMQRGTGNLVAVRQEINQCTELLLLADMIMTELANFHRLLVARRIGLQTGSN